MNIKVYAALAVALLAGLAAGYWAAQNTIPEHPLVPKETARARQPLYYRHPMNPAVTSPVPAKDEMGMDYVPVYAGEAEGGAPGTVRIDPVTVQNIGVRTQAAERRAISHAVRAVGRVGFDEERLARLHPKVEGWVEALHIDKTGQPVEKDVDLLSIYSPQLVSSQEEYLLALKNQRALGDSAFEDIRTGALELVKTSRERLEWLDVPEHQLRGLEESGKIYKDLHIHSPFDGIVMNVGVRKGQYVTPQTELYMIADLSQVWVYVDVYEYELPWVAVGDEAEMRLTGIPAKVFKGRVAYIYPYAEAKTRTIKVRLEFANPERLLKPEMFAEATIHAGRRVDAVVVPAEAVVRSGTRDQVFVVRGPGKFEPRVVELGLSAEGMVQVVSGVDPGERVVTSAQFLIDSESKLREATAKMLEAGAVQGAAGPPAAQRRAAETGAIPEEAMSTDHGSMNQQETDRQDEGRPAMDHRTMDRPERDHPGMGHGAAGHD